MWITYNSAFPNAIGSVIFIIILALSAYKTINGTITMGQLTLIIFYTNKIFRPLLSILQTVGYIQKTKISISRLGEILK